LNLVDRFNDIQRRLPDDWAEARLRLTVADDARCDRAAAMLGPANPGRRGKEIRFSTVRHGGGLAPEAVRRLLRRLVREGIAGELELVDVNEAAHAEQPKPGSLRAAWDIALVSLPPDWSDLYADVRLASTDYLERAALLLAPVNPARYGRETGFRFRCARHFGYGVSPEMAARCLQRCDDEGIRGSVEILRVLSDTYPVGTQGPVWYVGGRSV
jgi:hypothetical protein